jgi:hypothetical protein
MSTPNSPTASNEDVILPEILLPARYARASGSKHVYQDNLFTTAAHGYEFEWEVGEV